MHVAGALVKIAMSLHCGADRSRNAVPPALAQKGVHRMSASLRKLADRAVTQAYDPMGDLEAGRVKTANDLYAMNAWHLLRDAVLDLNALHVLVHDLIEQQAELLKLQIEERIFHGPDHAHYRRNSSQICAVNSSCHQLAKRLPDQCAYVTDAFLVHGTPLRCGSFGNSMRH